LAKADSASAGFTEASEDAFEPKGGVPENPQAPLAKKAIQPKKAQINEKKSCILSNICYNTIQFFKRSKRCGIT